MRRRKRLRVVGHIRSGRGFAVVHPENNLFLTDGASFFLLTDGVSALILAA